MFLRGQAACCHERKGDQSLASGVGLGTQDNGGGLRAEINNLSIGKFGRTPFEIGINNSDMRGKRMKAL